jgi:aminopeptidase N
LYYHNQVEICARPNAIDQTAFANSAAVELQEWFEEYHDVPYPLDKTSTWIVLVIILIYDTEN